MLEEVQVQSGAEEFSFGQGPVGALLIHGFTGSPQGLRSLGEFLAGKGIAVAGPRLPGHGTTWQDLNTHSHTDWAQAAEDAFFKLSSACDEVFVVGLSFGGALALDLAARYPARVAGIVTIAGIVHTKDPRRFLAPVIRRFVASLPGVANDIADPDEKELAYDRLPTAAAHSMLRFLKRARRALPAVRCPVLVMHSHNDHTVPPSNADVIHDEVASTDKELVWFERSYHVITLDYDRDEAFSRTYEFIKERSRHAI
jgi:carboxylesterase